MDDRPWGLAECASNELHEVGVALDIFRCACIDRVAESVGDCLILGASMLHMTREDPANEVVWDHLSRIAQPDFGQIKAQLLIQKVFPEPSQPTDQESIRITSND